jgi:hypothetical protein
MTECVIVQIAKADITRVIHGEPAFAELFIAHLLARNSRVEADLVGRHPLPVARIVHRYTFASKALP